MSHHCGGEPPVTRPPSLWMPLIVSSLGMTHWQCCFPGQDLAPSVVFSLRPISIHLLHSHIHLCSSFLRIKVSVFVCGLMYVYYDYVDTAHYTSTQVHWGGFVWRLKHGLIHKPRSASLCSPGRTLLPPASERSAYKCVPPPSAGSRSLFV